MAVRWLVQTAAYLGDNAPTSQYRTVYADDATWQMGGHVQHGVEEIIAAAETRRRKGIGGPGSDSKHIVTPTHVEFDSGDAGTVTSYLTYWVDVSTAPSIQVCATYRDRVRRTPEGWRIAQRTITSD